MFISTETLVVEVARAICESCKLEGQHPVNHAVWVSSLRTHLSRGQIKSGICQLERERFVVRSEDKEKVALTEAGYEFFTEADKCSK